jgi:hypothetical protein
MCIFAAVIIFWFANLPVLGCIFAAVIIFHVYLCCCNIVTETVIIFADYNIVTETVIIFHVYLCCCNIVTETFTVANGHYFFMCIFATVTLSVEYI